MVNVDQLFGIEIGEFPARIAETALWMTDHLANNQLSLEFGRSYVRIPLRSSPGIRHGDALETDWGEVLAPERCSYVLGNPPFLGSKYQSATQRAQVQGVAALGGTGGTLDYVTAWFLTAGAYLRRAEEAKDAQDGRRTSADAARRPPARVGFVSTNSITQGEQVAQLWPLLFDRCGLEIAFAHRTFDWTSDAPGAAHVHVVVLGLALAADAPRERRLFSYDHIRGDPHESRHNVLAAYLFDGAALQNPHLVVREVGRPINGMPQLIIGSKPIDGGHYIFDADERRAFLQREPAAKRLMRPFIGSREFLNGGERYILHLGDVPPDTLRALPLVRERIAKVRAYRQESESRPTQALAATPTRYHVNVVPNAPFLVVPEVSSERREYIPIAWLEPPVIPSNKVRILPNAALWQFAVLTSAAHMAWVRYIGGRLKSDYQYGIGVVYNTFPLPNTTAAAMHRLEPLAQAVLAARVAHPGATLADLYDPDLMPGNLRSAHRALDRAVDRLYRPAGFTSDRGRAEHLFGLYEQLTAPLAPAPRVRRGAPAGRAGRT